MNIELSYTEAVEVKHALIKTVKECDAALVDHTFKSKYPGCYKSIREQHDRCCSLVERIQAELGRL